MDAQTKLKRAYCPNCNSIYYLAMGSRLVGSTKFRFEIVGCQCESLLLYDRDQQNWRTFPTKFRKYPHFNTANRRFEL